MGKRILAQKVDGAYNTSRGNTDWNAPTIRPHREAKKAAWKVIISRETWKRETGGKSVCCFVMAHANYPRTSFANVSFASLRYPACSSTSSFLGFFSYRLPNGRSLLSRHRERYLPSYFVTLYNLPPPTSSSSSSPTLYLNQMTLGI